MMKLKSAKLEFEYQQLPQEPHAHVDVYMDADGEVTKIDLEGELYPGDVSLAMGQAHLVWAAISSTHAK